MGEPGLAAEVPPEAKASEDAKNALFYGILTFLAFAVSEFLSGITLSYFSQKVS